MTQRCESATDSPRSTRGSTSIVAWTPRGRHQEQLLVTALGGDAHLVCCRTEHELWYELARPGIGIFVLELTLDGRPKPASLIGAVRRRYAAMRIVTYGRLTQPLAAEVLACAKQGLDAIALEGFSNLRTVVHRTLAERNGAEEVVLLDLQHLLPPSLLEMVRTLLQRLDEAPQLDQLARLLDVSPRTLQRAASEARCCSPGDLICAVRVLVAARLLVYEAAPVKDVLRRTGFRSTRALRAALKRCGLLSMENRRGAAGYAAARDTLMRFVRPLSSDVAATPKRPERSAKSLRRSHASVAV